MTKEISLPEFYVSAKFEDGQLKADRILLKQRGEYVPYVLERTCVMREFVHHDDGTITYQCSECGRGYCEYSSPDYCPGCGAKVVKTGA